VNLYIMQERVPLERLPHLSVSYQAAQFAHLERHADIVWLDDPRCRWGGRFSECQRQVGVRADAVVVFDELTLLTSPQVAQTTFDGDALFVYVAHDYWCHPLRVAQDLARRPNVLMVLRHESARRLFDFLLPHVPKVVQRPGVETSIFHPRSGAPRYLHDILLGGSETPDYPWRQRLNRLVREHGASRGWRVLDLTAQVVTSAPRSAQLEYAPALAASKLSPTGSNRGGTPPGQLVMQYFDPSVARSRVDHPFYGLSVPELLTIPFEAAGITPRYLESMASRSLLVADLPACSDRDFYGDKMVALDERLGDGELVDLLDHWVHADEAREAIVERALAAILAGESSEARAAELAQLIKAQLHTAAPPHLLPTERPHGFAATQPRA
jgi:hypothetical protein